MVELARQRAPEARFIGSSLLGAELPACVAVTAIGECLNYATDPRTGRQQLATLFGRIHQALRPGGLFLFDVAEPGRERRVPRRTWHEGRTGCCAWRRSGRRTSGCCGGASRCSDRPPAAGGERRAAHPAPVSAPGAAGRPGRGPASRRACWPATGMPCGSAAATPASSPSSQATDRPETSGARDGHRPAEDEPARLWLPRSGAPTAHPPHSGRPSTGRSHVHPCRSAARFTLTE
jgi:hypothetical protein